MSVFLIDNILAFIFLEVLILLLLGICFYYALRILKHWDFSKSTSFQYSLEKQNYLINTIIYFAIIIKLVLFVFFIKSIDSLSSVVPGAMCAAGVIGANTYGILLLVFKLFILFLLGIWLLINKLDLKAHDFPFIREKYQLFVFLFALIIIEFIFEILYFSNIPLKVPVFCCTVVFQASLLPFGLSLSNIVILFYVVFISIVFSYFSKQVLFNLLANLAFLFVSYYALSYFFGTYIYQMPNHICPYCMLLPEYHFIGYFLWGSLFLGVFFSIAYFVLKIIIKEEFTHFLRYSLYLEGFFTFLCTWQVIWYVFTHGAFL